MDKSVTIYCKNTKSYHSFPLGISLIEIYNALEIKLKYKLVAARVNYKVEDLNFLVYKPKDVEFIDLSVPSGMRVYVRTLSMVISKAVTEIFQDKAFRIEHPISKGYYCMLDGHNGPITEDIIVAIKLQVKKIIAEGQKIVSEEKQTKVVKELFGVKKNQKDKVSLFETLCNPYCRFLLLFAFTFSRLFGCFRFSAIL